LISIAFWRSTERESSDNLLHAEFLVDFKVFCFFYRFESIFSFRLAFLSFFEREVEGFVDRNRHLDINVREVSILGFERFLDRGLHRNLESCFGGDVGLLRGRDWIIL
jgi:hypothetical protein